MYIKLPSEAYSIDIEAKFSNNKLYLISNFFIYQVDYENKEVNCLFKYSSSSIAGGRNMKWYSHMEFLDKELLIYDIDYHLMMANT